MTSGPSKPGRTNAGALAMGILFLLMAVLVVAADAFTVGEPVVYTTFDRLFWVASVGWFLIPALLSFCGALRTRRGRELSLLFHLSPYWTFAIGLVVLVLASYLR